MRRSRIDYGIENGVDIFVGLTWPDVFLRDPAYALFRPLYDKTSPWKKDRTALNVYLNSQARRLGGRKALLFHFSNLSMISEGYSYFQSFLSDPFEYNLDLSALFLDIDKFLRWRFRDFIDDPWKDYPLEMRMNVKSKNKNKSIIEKNLIKSIVLSEQDRKRLLKKELSKIPWQTQLQRSLEYENGMEGFHSALVEKAVKECPELLKQGANEDLVTQIFSVSSDLNIDIGDNGYKVIDAPVMLGSHYLNKQIQKQWFDERGRKFHRILGCYARWDDAKVVVFTSSIYNDEIRYKRMLDDIKSNSLMTVGEVRRVTYGGIDYFLSLLVDMDIPAKSFLVSEWELNTPHLTILERVTKDGND